MIIDMSHSGEQSTLETIELSQRPIVISHANPLSFHSIPRNKSETVLKALSESGGLLGFSLFPMHLKDGARCTLDSFCEMVARTAEFMGVEHLGIGSDLCQSQPRSVMQWMGKGRWMKDISIVENRNKAFQWPESVSWFQDNRDFANIAQGLLKQGFHDQEVANIMGLNWLRVLQSGLQPEG